MFGNAADFIVPTSLALVVDSRKRPERFGRLNVVEPSPEPYFVPITAKRFAYVVRLTAAPLHSSQPSGTVWK